MANSYYTSLFRAWLDHEVLSKPEAKDYLIEIICEDNGKCLERVCEWLIDSLYDTRSVSNTHTELLEHEGDIDFIRISRLLCEEYKLIM